MRLANQEKKEEASLEAWGKSLTGTGLSVFPGLSERISVGGLLESTSSFYRSFEHVAIANANHIQCIMYKPDKAVEMEFFVGDCFVAQGFSLKLKVISQDSSFPAGMEFPCDVFRGWSKDRACTPYVLPTPIHSHGRPAQPCLPHTHHQEKRLFFFFLIFILFLVTFISFSFLSFFLFIWLHQVLVAACKIFIASRGLLCSSCGARALECTGSVAVARRLSCLTARGILVPRPGIEPVSPALEGGFLTTGPPGKSGKEAL